MIKLTITNQRDLNKTWIANFIITKNTIQWVNENWEITSQSEIDSMESIMNFVEKVWFNIPSACRAGACFACACKVNSWEECLDQEKYWSKLIDTVPWEFLSCIGGIKDEYLEDDKIHQVDLEVVG